MRLFRKIKRKLLPKYKSIYRDKVDIRRHRLRIYKSISFVQDYYYSNNDFTDDFWRVSQINILDAIESINKYGWNLNLKQLEEFELINDLEPFKFAFMIYGGYSKSSEKRIYNPFMWYSDRLECACSNRKQFLRFWKVYSQAPFWKKYKIWLKKKEINKDF